MLQILIDGREAAISKDISFDFTRENPFFGGGEDYSLSIEFPMRGCAANQRIFANLNRRDIAKHRAIYDCQIIAGEVQLHGAMAVVGATEHSVKGQFMSNRTAANYWIDFDNIYINELDLGNAMIDTTDRAHDLYNKNTCSAADALKGNSYDGYPVSVALQWANNQDDEDSTVGVQNSIYRDGNKYKWAEPGRPDRYSNNISRQPYLIWITRKICEAVGYRPDLSQWLKLPYKNLLCCNCLPAAWEAPGFAKALPHWSVTEYFDNVGELLNAVFDIDHIAKTVTYRPRTQLLAAAATYTPAKVVDSFAEDISTDEAPDTDYIGNKPRRYSAPEYYLWKYYDCDWYIALSGDGAYRFNTLTEALARAKELFYPIRSDKITENKSLFYAEDADMYFLMKCERRELLEDRSSENKPNIYNCYCYPVPVNIYGTGNTDEDVNYTELKLVPVMIDRTGELKGEMMFLKPGGYNEEKAARNPYDKSEYTQEEIDDINSKVLQSRSYNTLSNGESTTPEYYDRIYIAEYTGAIRDSWNVPMPMNDRVFIDQNFAVKGTASFSFRVAGQCAEGLPRILTTHKLTIKFIDTAMPSPLSTFVIDGQRYVCAKLSTNFTIRGMNNIIKAELYPIAEV